MDNSEWMRNGDYVPTRLEAQKDAVHLIFGSKTQSNPENTVGLMTMAGKGPEVLVNFTNDLGQILSATHSLRICGQSNISSGIQVAQLALKHRLNKNQGQRIVVFVGSPVAEDEKALVKLGKKLKKNNVSVDVVNFGEQVENEGKLEAFISSVNSNENSHLITVPPGPHILSDILISSPIIAGENGAPVFASSGGGYEFGVDPNLDPELALALRISLEEERARHEGNAVSMAVDELPVHADLSDEDAMLAQALAMSMDTAKNEDVNMAESSDASQSAVTPIAGNNPELMSSILGSLPGVNANDPRIKNAIGASSTKDSKDASKKGNEKNAKQ